MAQWLKLVRLVASLRRGFRSLLSRLPSVWKVQTSPSSPQAGKDIGVLLNSGGGSGLRRQTSGPRQDVRTAAEIGNGVCHDHDDETTF
jgi:hypothetical protein